jgi:hypothetical protein
VAARAWGDVFPDHLDGQHTPENLALVDLVVPEGYTPDTNLPRDDRSSQGGCA